MSAIPKYFSKNFDEEEFNIWKGRQVQKARANRSFANFTRLKHINSYYYKQKRKVAKERKENQGSFDLSQYHKDMDRNDKLFSGGYEVIVKITSNAKNKNQLFNHINYISRDGQLELLDENNHIYFGNEDTKYCVENFENIPEKFYYIKERRETYNMVFSMRDYEECDPQKLQESAFATIKKLYPDSQFVLALHKDTDNPHCHICLNANKANGDRIHIQKKDLFAMRQTFARELNDRGIYALATKRSDKYRGREMALNIQKSNIKLNLNEKFYKIVDFGEKPYNDDSLNKNSFFISYLVNGDKVTIWGEQLKELAQSSGLKQSDFVRLKKIGYKLRPYTFEKKIDGKLYEITNASKVAIWDISIRDRAEKEFTNLPKPPTFKPIVRLKEVNKPIKKDTNANTTTTKYTREQWARFNAERNARKFARIAARFNKSNEPKPRYNAFTGFKEQYPEAAINAFTGFRESNTELQWRALLSKPYLDTFGSEIATKHDLSKLPQSNVDKKSTQHKMLLSNDAQHNLSRRQDRTDDDNRELRCTNNSNPRNKDERISIRNGTTNNGATDGAYKAESSTKARLDSNTSQNRYTREQWARFNAERKKKNDFER